MRARSPKRAKAERRYTYLRAQYLETHPWCEGPWNCAQYATEIHHAAGRSGDRINDISRFKALCRGCHQYATEHPAEAYELGVSERRIGGAA